jgi:hypothetical protein
MFVVKRAAYHGAVLKSQPFLALDARAGTFLRFLHARVITKVLLLAGAATFTQ